MKTKKIKTYTRQNVTKRGKTRKQDANAKMRQPITEPEELGNACRIRWVVGRHGEAPTVAGTYFIIARDGRIAAIYLFFDKLP